MWLDKVNKLKLENPEAEIIFSISEYDVDFEENSGWYLFNNAKIELSRRILFGDEFTDDKGRLEELVVEDLISEYPEMMEWSDENFQVEVDKRLKELEKEWKTYIIVNIK